MMANLQQAMDRNRAENSASGSDMSTVLASWSYILPALNYIMRDPVATMENRAPSLPVAQHASIYTVVYNFATASRSGIAAIPAFGMTGATGLREGFDPEQEAGMDRFERVRATIGYELYSLLEDYFRDLAREIRLNAPLPPNFSSTSPTPAKDKSSAKKGKSRAPPTSGGDFTHPLGDEAALIAYYSTAYIRYSTGAAQINRLFAYLNRHFIMRAIDEGCGWISLADVMAASMLKDLASIPISPSDGVVARARKDKPPTTALASHKKTKDDLKKLEAKKQLVWRKWGYDASIPRETEEERKAGEHLRKIAELCAEAASASERIVTCSALAMRSWRLEVVEPLLDPAFWNTNGRKDVFAGTPPIPPTPTDLGLHHKGPHSEENASESKTVTVAKRSLNLPVLLSSAASARPPPNGALTASQQKGKAKSRVTLEDDMELTIPVQLAITAPTSNSGRAEGKAGGGATSLEGDIQDGHKPSKRQHVNSSAATSAISPSPTGTSTDSTANGSVKKRPAVRKTVPRSTGPQTSLAAVRAATAAAAAAREAEENGQVGAVAIPPQKGRLNRAVTLMLETRLLKKAETSGMDTRPLVEAKDKYSAIVADSLMMCGMSPDHPLRRRLDRFLSKGEVEVVPGAKW